MVPIVDACGHLGDLPHKWLVSANRAGESLAPLAVVG